MTNGALPRKGRLTVSWTKTGMLTTKGKKKTKKKKTKKKISEEGRKLKFTIMSEVNKYYETKYEEEVL